LPIPPEEQLVRELDDLLPTNTANGAAKGNPHLLRLHIVGGPTHPTSQTEKQRVDQLWTRLRSFMEDGQLERELARESGTDHLKDDYGDTISPVRLATAALVLFRASARRTSWVFTRRDGQHNLTPARKAADAHVFHLIEPKHIYSKEAPGSYQHFTDHYERPILAALARLLIKAEQAHRAAENNDSEDAGTEPAAATRAAGVEGTKPADRPPSDAVLLKSFKEARLLLRRLPARPALAWAAGVAAILSVATMATRAITADNEPAQATLEPTDFSVSLRSTPPDGEADSIIALGSGGGPADLTFRADLRSTNGKDGRIPHDLRMVVVVPRKSMRNKVLPSAHLEVAGNPVAERGQGSSDSVTVLARDGLPIGLTHPSSVSTDHARTGSHGDAPRLVSPRFISCDKRYCTVRIPVARFVSRLDADGIFRVSFQATVFTLRQSSGPLLMIDLKQRRIEDREQTDDELRVRPGNRMVYSAYVRNVGDRPARNVVARFELTRHLRLTSGSARVAASSRHTPVAVEDNLTNGGVRYKTFSPGAVARFAVSAKVRRTLADVGEAYPYWLVKSKETRGSEYFDSVTTSLRR
jgi:hypothetical protein